MPTTLIAKLTHGKNYIDLMAAPYSLPADFAPPTRATTLVTSGGTSANRNGASRIDAIPVNRAWSFKLKIGSATSYTTAQMHAATGRVQRMLDEAEDETNPVYFEWRSNSDMPEPIWGTAGANLRYRIVSGSIRVPPTYGVKPMREKTLICDVDLIIKPYAENKPQLAALASGGVLYDTLGSVDGTARCLIVPEATTNVFTNPVFGDSVYSTGWTVGTSLVLTQNTDRAFCWPGQYNSAYVYSKASTNNLFTQSVTLSASTSFITIYVKKYDLAAVSSTDCEITYNGSTQTTTFTSWGNGVYQLRASVTGTGGAAACGLIVKIGRGVVVLGAQAEVKAYYTPLCYGDMLGCAWTGTAHASTSSRTAGQIKLSTPENYGFNYQSGCIRIAVEYPMASTAASASTPGGGFPYFFSLDSAGAGFIAYLQKSDNTIRFTDNTTTLASSAVTWSERQRDIYHFCWSPQSRTIYRNGVSLATTAAYVIPTAISTLSILASVAATSQSQFGLFDFALFNYEPTAQQVADDYANLYPLIITDGYKSAPVPYLWTKDGDGLIDNADDSSYDNWAVLQGVPGTIESGYLAEFYKASNPYTVWLGRMATRDFVYPRNLLFHDFSGTVDANSSGGEYTNTAALSTSEATLGSNNPSIFPQWYFAIMAGGTFIPFIRAYDATTSSALYWRIRFSPNNSVASNYLYSDYKTFTTPGSSLWNNYPGQPFTFAPEEEITMGGVLDKVTIPSIYAEARGYRASGSAAFRCDYLFLMPEQCIEVGISANTRRISIDDKGRMPGYTLGSRDYLGPVWYTKQVNGWRDGFAPERYNWFFAMQGYGASDSAISATVTFTAIYIIPRYALL